MRVHESPCESMWVDCQWVHRRKDKLFYSYVPCFLFISMALTHTMREIHNFLFLLLKKNIFLSKECFTESLWPWPPVAHRTWQFEASIALLWCLLVRDAEASQGKRPNETAHVCRWCPSRGEGELMYSIRHLYLRQAPSVHRMLRLLLLLLCHGFTSNLTD